MNILGVAFLADASACVLHDGKLVSAVSEERMNRVKLWYGVPHKAIEEALRLAGLGIEDIDLIATHGNAPTEPDPVPYDERAALIDRDAPSPEARTRQLDALRSRQQHEQRIFAERTPGYLEAVRSYGKPMFVTEHHTAHASSAHFGAGWGSGYVLTADGWGEDASATVWRSEDGAMRRIAYSNTFDSLGYFYGSITKALNFIPHRHEGKVLGLAAYCADPTSYPAVRSMIDYDSGQLRFLSRMERGVYVPRFENPTLKDLVSGYPREDVAAAAQRSLEEVVCALVGELEGDDIKVALAGGVFANVKLNQRIREMQNVSDVFVFPNMGDGGLSVGAAWLAHFEQTGRRPMPLSSMLVGGGPECVAIGEVLQQGGLRYTVENDIEGRIAELLADGQIVARCAGPMEFGPRALGNRSILYKATEPGVNQWLNERLGRSEFMPFAPMTLGEHADTYFNGLDGGRGPASFMTMTFDCTQRMCDEAPAAVHIDRTARPQIVTAEAYPQAHRILKEYHRRTGLSNIINTSFNMHEEPIVYSAEDAIRAFKASNLPYLALENFLVARDDELLAA